ncbi:MAG: FAD-dependent monooxygenase [Bacillus sp. (in: firmicutes)]
MTVLHADVCIVGAGPGGALLAYLLAQANISTLLLERHQHINKEFRGEHLNEEGVKVLHQAGLYKKLEDIGLLHMERVEFVEKGKVFKTILPDSNSSHTGIHVPQNHLLKLLVKEAKQFSSFRLQMNSRVVDVQKDVHSNYNGVTAIINNEKTTIKSKIIVAADGRFSIIRNKADFPVEMIRHGYDLLWAKVPAPSNWEPTIKMALVKDRQVSLFTQYGGYIQIGWNIEEGTFPQVKKESFQVFIKGLVEAFPELEQTVTEHIRSWQDFVLLKVQSSKSSLWVKNNVVLLGDAAHTMSPTGAFGLNSSLKDAEVLAQVIKKVLLKNQPPTFLKDYEKRRKETVDAIQLEQLKRETSFKDHFDIK